MRLLARVPFLEPADHRLQRRKLLVGGVVGILEQQIDTAEQIPDRDEVGLNERSGDPAASTLVWRICDKPLAGFASISSKPFGFEAPMNRVCFLSPPRGIGRGSK
jgi:hypothetical protein